MHARVGRRRAQPSDEVDLVQVRRRLRRLQGQRWAGGGGASREREQSDEQEESAAHGRRDIAERVRSTETISAIELKTAWTDHSRVDAVGPRRGSNASAVPKTIEHRQPLEEPMREPEGEADAEAAR